MALSQRPYLRRQLHLDRHCVKIPAMRLREERQSYVSIVLR
jgi:hypothetical protein